MASTPPGSSPPTTGARTAILRVFAAADRGMAMGHIDGKVAFVPFAAPGDKVEVELVREKRRYVETRLLQVLEPSALRRTPACSHFGRCGGCQWQHLPYPEQLQAKDRSFRGFVKSRLGLRGDPPFRDPVASPREWGYRNRVGLKVRRVADRTLVGFFALGTHRLVDVDHCPVAHPSIDGLLGPLRRFLQEFGPARGSLPQVDLQSDGNGSLHVVFHLLRPLGSREIQSLSNFSAEHAVAAAFVQAGRKDTLAPLTPGLSGVPFTLHLGPRNLHLEVPPGGFVQANWEVNQKLVDEVRDLADLYRDRAVLDLYCGAGNFTLPLATVAREVVAVEGFPPAAQALRKNAERNGLDHVRVLQRSARSGLQTLAADGFRPHFCLLDPPREGAGDVIGSLAELAPEHILYVSCAPPTLVRDLEILSARGYRLRWSRAADMFPQTAHLETVTLLERSDAEPQGD